MHLFSGWLFGDDLTIRVMNISANKNLSAAKNFFYNKSLIKFSENHGNSHQTGYQRKIQATSETLHQQHKIPQAEKELKIVKTCNR